MPLSFIFAIGINAFGNCLVYNGGFLPPGRVSSNCFLSAIQLVNLGGFAGLKRQQWRFVRIWGEVL